MTGLAKITEKILSEARNDASARLAEADAEVRRISAVYASKAELIRAKAEEMAKAEARKIIHRARAGEAVARRNAVLKMKSRLVDKAFELAYEELLRLDDEKYFELLVTMLTCAAREKASSERLGREYGDEITTGEAKCTVYLNSRDTAKYGDRIAVAARERLGDEYRDILTVSDAPVKIDGGLIFGYGQTEINCSLSSVTSRVRPSLEAEVCNRLFPPQKELKYGDTV